MSSPACSSSASSRRRSVRPPSGFSVGKKIFACYKAAPNGARGIHDNDGWPVPTKRKPTDEEYRDLLFAWRAVASVKSNAIVIARDGATIGIGAGQMSRVDAAFMAVHKAATAGHATAGAAL